LQPDISFLFNASKQFIHLFLEGTGKGLSTGQNSNSNDFPGLYWPGTQAVNQLFFKISHQIKMACIDAVL